jgi:lipopolysaccharide/colanic/teichoic acid biosynthesis glycosyltransferase
MLKRSLDLGLSSLGLLLLSPLLLLIALAIKWDSPGPIFFRQERVGRYGAPFRIFKFRTMRQCGGDLGPQLTVAGDTRITRLGRTLRSTKLDELAQLIDVLRGTMSLVGPRPEVPKYVAYYPDELRTLVLSVRPGITDLASLHYHDENDLLAQSSDPEREYLHVILPIKLKYAEHYVQHRALHQDVRILVLTLRQIFSHWLRR